MRERRLAQRAAMSLDRSSLPSPSFHHDPGMTQLSGKVEELLREAGEIADARGHAIVGTEHVLLAMTRQSDDSFVRRLLDEFGVTDDLRSRIESVIGPG